jgi:hypothetical protein
MNRYKDLTDNEFKVYYFIRGYNEGKERFYLPAAMYVAVRLGKSERTILRAYAGLRKKGVLG